MEEKPTTIRDGRVNIIVAMKSDKLLQHQGDDEDFIIPKQYYHLSMLELRLYADFLRALVFSSLKEVGVCVLDHFLPDINAESVRKEVETLYNEESSKIVSNDLQHRGDETAWVDHKDSQKSNIQILSKAFENLILSMARLPELRKRKFRVTHKSHLQVSRFKHGRKGYKPHIENPNDNGRLLSVAYFTNKEYLRNEHHGLVRFFLKSRTKVAEIEPKFNVAVIYWSDKRVVKEVTPTQNRELYHMTSWFFGSCENSCQF